MCSTSGSLISCFWYSTSSSNGSHTIVASALDPSGNLGTTTATVTVNNGGTPGGGGDTTPPTISITSPYNGATVGKNVYVAATASDNVGVVSVSFYVDNALVATDSSASYGFTWKSQQYSRGSHTLTAKAKDAAGNVGSSSITVTVR